MEKRYQVFVSSTYEDLQEERKEVMQALLELDCIPAGMELFPASNDDQWSLIKRVIDDCDYYLLIIGGRYGSCNKDGISYTEQEYRYALETGKPIISFLHKSPENIPNKFTEQDSEKRQKFSLFRDLAQNKMVKYWNSPAELGSVVSRSMIKLIKQYPAIGWVKADNIEDPNSAKEILRLRDQVNHLNQIIEDQSSRPPAGTDNFAQGDEQIEMSLIFEGRDKNYKQFDCRLSYSLSWNTIFSAFSPHLVNEGTEDEIVKSIISLIKTNFKDDINEFMKNKKLTHVSNFKLDVHEFQIVKVQFKALGLIRQSQKNRSVKDTQTYWTLTTYGDHVMTKLIALPRNVEVDK